MAEYFKPEHMDNLVMRMQIRANHIYILFIALLNIVAYRSNFSSKDKKTYVLEIVFRLFLMLSGIFALIAFLKEHTGDLSVRTWTLLTVILSVTAIGLLLLNELFNTLRRKS
ncbi:hypothetical protein [Tenacibaculum sp. 190524A05c]|uniref:hypothetical protein n=1 Tax=Tenacibaculum platacis TaxID=3137852 RepID=UPI0032B1D01C